MAKTEKELQELKEKVEEVNKELRELTDEELEQVADGHFNFTPILGFMSIGN